MAAEYRREWTIDELGEAVANALAVDYSGAPSGRVRDVPDRRTIRYYTTLGLIDRPASMRGRTALYGRRHLLQLVAIKRLQAKGLTLAEVQAQLAGASTRVLEHVASIADDVAPPAKMSPVTGAKEIGGEEIERDTESFWSSLPSDDVTPVEATGPREPRQSEEEVSEPPALLNGMRIGQDLVLLLSPKRAIEDDDVRALEAASEPLVRLLRERGLI